jgi:SHS2 domain-containing protein
MRYEILEHTADVMIRAHGATVEECFENAAFGMMDQILDANAIGDEIGEEMTVEGGTLDELLYNFLSEVLFIFDARNLALGHFQVSIGHGWLRCHAKGEPFDRTRHSPRQEIKAVTYHMLEVNEEEPSVTVLFDV